MSSSEILRRARVCEAAQEQYRVRFAENGEDCPALPAGALRWKAELPAVGDWVRARRVDADLALIESVEARTTCISRQRAGGDGGEQVLAANVDRILIVMGLDGDYNLRRLERYLVLAAASGTVALVVLNKRDMCADWPARLAAVQAVSAGVACLAISAHESVTEVAAAVYGQTVALLGSSGAGKSTIANALVGEAWQSTQPVRASDSRGRHTTTRRSLVELPGGGALIDTPGMRELALWAGEDSVEEAFGDIAELASRCRFPDCTHGVEPGCAVAAALDSGAIGAARWASYLKLLAEARYHERAANKSAAAAEKRKWKTIHKAMRDHPKYRR